jgi:hypothetical protein
MALRTLIQISIYLPLYYNPRSKEEKRRRVEQSKFSQTYDEIIERFGAYTLIKNVEGVWIDQEGNKFQDWHYLLIVVAADTLQTRRWLRRFKARLEDRFQQKEIFINILQSSKL